MLLLSSNSGGFQAQLSPVKGGFQEKAMCFSQYAIALVIGKLPPDSKESLSSPLEAVTM